MSKVTADDLVALIRKRYSLHRADGIQKYVVLEQVPDGTGMNQGRWIDVVVFDLWPSKGLLRSAFEIKASRGDFLREIANPLKYKWAVESFHEFWFVAPQDVIKMEELPANAGWLFPCAGKLAIKRRAVQNPDPKLDEVLLAAFMRAAAKEVARVSCVSVQDVLDNDTGYQLGKLYIDAVTSFINKRGVRKYQHPSNQEELLAWLEEATLDNQLKEDREHLFSITGRFQRQMVSLLKLFLAITNKSLLARNELGEYIVKHYGGDDAESVESLRERIKGSKRLDMEKRYLQFVELLLNWDREFNESD